MEKIKLTCGNCKFFKKKSKNLGFCKKTTAEFYDVKNRKSVRKNLSTRVYYHCNLHKPDLRKINIDYTK